MPVRTTKGLIGGARSRDRHASSGAGVVRPRKAAGALKRGAPPRPEPKEVKAPPGKEGRRHPGNSALRKSGISIS